MVKGYLKADETAGVLALLGAVVGAAVGQKIKGTSGTLIGATLGAVALQGVRAAVDPELEAERKLTG